MNGIPVGPALNTFKQQNPELAENPAELLNATRGLIRDWPDGHTPSASNLFEQVEHYANQSSDIPLGKPFEVLLQENGILLQRPDNEFVGLLTANLSRELVGLPEMEQIASFGAGDDLSIFDELDKLEERQMTTPEERETITLLFIQHQGERTNVMLLDDTTSYVDTIAQDYADPARQKQLYDELRKKDPKAVFLDDRDMYAMLTLTHGADFAKAYAAFQQAENQRKQV